MSFLGRLVAATALVAAVASSTVVTSPASATPTAERAVFTGQFVGRPDLVVRGTQRLRVYVVSVERVYENAQILTQRVTVVSTQALERCGLPSQSGTGGTGGTGGTSGTGGGAGGGQNVSAPLTFPDAVDRQLRLFEAIPSDQEFRVASCDGVTIVDDEVAAAILDTFGEGRVPGRPSSEQPSFDDVGFACPDSGQALTDLDASSGCETLADDDSSLRLFAPGLALVLIGALGLLLARRRH